MRLTATLIIISVLSLTGRAQNSFLNGFREKVSGADFSYHSPYSSNRSSLLLRARQDFEPVVWLTDTVPVSMNESHVSFVWLYGMDVLSNQQQFKLSVNDVDLFTFSNPYNNDNETWEAQTLQEGAQLVFHRSMIDKYRDQMGFAVLTLPLDMLVPGQAAKIEVEAIYNDSPAWYMTFTNALRDSLFAEQLQVIAKENNRLFHIVRFNIVHLSSPHDAILEVDEYKQEVRLKTGLNEIDFLIPKVEEPTTVQASLIIDERIRSRIIDIAPVKEWTIHLVQHSHTDIGYTRPQSEILAEHLQFIDLALDYCDQTDHLPDDAQFRWTCEASWTVEAYLESRPQEQVQRLLKRIREGRIEVTGMYFNFSEIIDETALAIQAQTLRQFQELGIDVTTAMQNDINGIGWCMVDIYHDTGVKYLTMGQHGHRARIPFDKPTSFWWESPSGNRLLAFRSEHYMHGNTLSFTHGEMDVFRDNLSTYLLDLERKDYPFNRAVLQFSGYVTDNSPPSTRACKIVDEWNEKYEWPKLKLSLASEFMLYLEDNHAEQLQVRNVAWPDWWTDGFGSAMNETKLSRAVHAELIATTGLLPMAMAAGSDVHPSIPDEIRQCYENLFFYDEHTFGADESISNPLSANSINQWNQKSSYVWSANQQARLLREKVLGLLSAHIPKSQLPTITVFNTLNWQRSGLVEVFISHDMLPQDKAFLITDVYGDTIAAQLINSRGGGTNWALWIEDIPPLGYTSLTIHVVDELDHTTTTIHSSDPFILENQFYRLIIHPDRPGIKSLFDKQLQLELTDQANDYLLAEFLLEELNNRSDLERLTKQNRDTVYRAIEKTITGLSNFRVIKQENHQLWSSVFLDGQLAACAGQEGVSLEIRLHHHTKKIEFIYSMNKIADTDPVGGYIAFPFKVNDEDQLIFEVQGGVVEPGVNQLEGTASDWNTVQNFAAVRNDEGQIVFISHDTPLVHFGAINTGHYYYRNRPENGHIYSWVFNNYWTTNFKASQEGELEWSYHITSSSDNSIALASKFGWENRVPLVARLQSARNDATVLDQQVDVHAKSIIDLGDLDNLLLVNARPSLDGTNIFIHLREIEGDHAILDIDRLTAHSSINEVVEVNILEQELESIRSPLLIEHFETKFLLLKLAE